MSIISSAGISTNSDSTGRTEHLKLAGIVKAVHAKLRRKYKKDRDFDELWSEHVRNKDLLSEYADAMHHLAVDHWSKNPETRIDWCRSVCVQYFIHGDLQRVLDKDVKRKAFICQREKEESQRLESENGTLSVKDLSPSLANGIHDSNKFNAMDGGKNSDNSAGQTFCSQESFTRDSIDILDNSFDELQDACNLLEEKCDLNSDRQQLGSEISPIPVILDDEEQPVESKCEEYLGRLSASPQGDCSQVTGDCTGNIQDQLDQDAIYSKYGPTNYTTVTLPVKGKLRLLDVGSCYNAFLQFEEFVAIGVDISPAVESVFCCDFLHLKMLEPLQLASDTHDSWLASLRSPITRLPRDCFHVVVFSLLLEYFPSAYQRWLCCQKAHQLLMMNGLLLIITPDSHSVNRAAPQMKSWKLVIESLGFKRYKYEKQDHLHCMAFRKVPEATTSSVSSDITPDILYIPQDFNSADDIGEDFLADPRTELEDDELSHYFMELPEFDMF